MRISKSKIKSLVKEEVKQLRKEYKIKVPHERIGWLAQVVNSVEQEPQSGADDMISFVFSTFDGGRFIWDLNTVQEKGNFDVIKETTETAEAISLITNLQTEYQDASKIVSDLRKILGRIKRPVEPEEEDL